MSWHQGQAWLVVAQLAQGKVRSQVSLCVTTNMGFAACRRPLVDLPSIGSSEESEPDGGVSLFDLRDPNDDPLGLRPLAANAAPPAAVATTPRAASTNPSAASDTQPGVSSTTSAAAGDAQRPAPLSLVAMHSTLQEISVPAVPDVSELLCCPITHVRTTICNLYTLNDCLALCL